MNNIQNDIGVAFAKIRTELDQSARNSGRNPDEVTLMAASKTVETDRLKQALESGHRFFCENRVQEAKAKWPELLSRYDDTQLHLVGPLQSNKVRDAVTLFDVIQSVDRLKLIRAIARISDETGQSPRVFIQVNIAAEPQKAGVMPETADALINSAQEILGDRVLGLMCIPPAQVDPAPYFDQLRNMAERNSIHELSMGMSGDFPIAVAHGATCVRVGSAIFGQRAAIA